MDNVRVFYVEDEPFLGKIVRESLESRGFVVEMVADGKRAVEAFAQSHADICVLDVMLPQLDGYAVAQAIRAIKPAIPIIFVTAKTQTDDVIKGFESGGNDYLRKPFSMEELIVRIQNLLRLSGKTASMREVLTLGKFQFHANRFELSMGATVKKLTHREAVLLQALCENINTPVTRKEILMKVWGDDSFFNSRNLDVYISKLREYFRPDPAIQIITLKGVGYQFTVG